MTLVSYVSTVANYSAIGMAYYNGKVYTIASETIVEVDPADGSVTATKTKANLGLSTSSSYPLRYLFSNGTHLYAQWGSQYGVRFAAWDTSWNQVLSNVDYPNSDTYIGVDIYNSNFGWTSQAAYIPMRWIRTGDYKGQILHCYNGTFYRKSFLAATSHTKLASPVTKTSENTMKITFQFNVTLPL